MNLKDLREMIKIMNENGLAEIEIESDGMKVKVKKAVTGDVGFSSVSVPSLSVVPVRQEAIAVPAPVISSSETSVHLSDIKSPMVGSFYRSPSPEAAPFIEIGQMVEIGQVVCIVEAMKLLNEIKSEVRGKVVEVCVDNAEPVEFGQILFRVSPVK